MKFLTESGSIYEIDGDHIRRINGGYGKRADGEWVRLVEQPKIREGHCAFLVLESLSAYGSDDYGTVDPSDVTMRRTTPVERVWADD